MDENTFSLILIKYLFDILLSYKVRDEQEFINQIYLI